MLFIGNGRLVTRDTENPFIDNGAVVSDGGRIVAVGETSSLRALYPEAEFLDARGGVIMPGLINAHEHIYSTLARGMAIAGYCPNSFLDILEGLWWKLDRVLNNKDTEVSADAAFIDCIKNGVTTVFDHHASYGEIDGSLDVLSDAAYHHGLRACLCYEVSDRDGTDKMRRAVQENVRFMKKTAAGDGMQAGTMGLHASFTLSDQTLDLVAAEMPGASRCHIHVAEAQMDAQDALDKYGRRIVVRLYQHGLLGKKTIAAHCVHVSGEETALLRESGAVVVHNPESNMSNAVGCGPAVEMLESGILVGLGTDGYTKDMFESFKAGCLIHKHRQGDPKAATGALISMLFENNPIIAERLLGVKTGVLKKGFEADVIVVDYDPTTPMTAENADYHILFGMTGANVVTTVAAGKVLMRDRVILTADEARVRARSREQASDLWKRVNA